MVCRSTAVYSAWRTSRTVVPSWGRAYSTRCCGSSIRIRPEDSEVAWFSVPCHRFFTSSSSSCPTLGGSTTSIEPDRMFAISVLGSEITLRTTRSSGGDPAK